MAREAAMKRKAALFVASAMICIAAPRDTIAQPAPHSTLASPEVYRVIAQNDKFRVIAVNWKPGQRDAWHSHPEAAVYFLTFCHLRMHSPDGKSRDVSPPAEYSAVQGPITSHSLENIGKTDCKLVMFEPK
jgi:mannose-6-phosphate isomerase-like protein (cupin superfamily)